MQLISTGGPNSLADLNSATVLERSISPIKMNIHVCKKQMDNTHCIFEDLAEETMEKRRAQLPQLRQAKAQGKIAYFSLDKLIIKDRPNGSGTMASYSSISG